MLFFFSLAFVIAMYDPVSVWVIASVVVIASVAMTVYIKFLAGKLNRGPFGRLPTELRLHIWEECLRELRPEQSFRHHEFRNALTERLMPLDTLGWVGKTKTPALLNVSKNMRAEAGEVYYKKGVDIYLGWERSDPIDELRKWQEVVVRDLDVHVRDLRVHISRVLPTVRSYLDEHEYTIRVQLEPGTNKLTADGFRGTLDDEATGWGTRGDVYFDVWGLGLLSSHASAIETRRAELGHRGEAIFAFFLAEPEAIRWVCLGPSTKWVRLLDQAGRPHFSLVLCSLNDPLMNIRHS